MTKHDQPPLILVVDGNGKLSGATEYDYERICEYPRGTQLTMTPYQGRDINRLRRYWAILGRLVKDAPTPWNSAEEASDALKLALGVTDIGKTVTGQWFVRPGSVALSSMDEARFREFFDQAMAVLAQVTGVDPTRFGRETPNSNPGALSSSQAPAPDGGVSPPASPSTLSPAGSNTASRTEEVAPARTALPVGGGGNALSPSPAHYGDIRQ